MNKYILARIGMIVLAIILSSCSKKQEIKRIDVKYYTGIFEAILDISYQELQDEKPRINNNPMDVEETAITNPQILLQIQQELSKIKVVPEKDDLEDVRIICTIEYNNGQKDSLSIDGKYTDALRLNKHYYKGNYKLIYLIKKNIGYYFRMHEDMYPLFYELQDTCFKDTIMNDRGQKYWRGKPNRFSPDGSSIWN